MDKFNKSMMVYPNLIYFPSADMQKLLTIKILRIIKDVNFTRIDFIEYPNKKCNDFGWSNVKDEMFIRDNKNEEKLKLIRAVNIPIAPKKHFFKNEDDCHVFSLYFPRLLPKVYAIDIIESEDSKDRKDYNFYGVDLTKLNVPYGRNKLNEQ